MFYIENYNNYATDECCLCHYFDISVEKHMLLEYYSITQVWRLKQGRVNTSPK